MTAVVTLCNRALGLLGDRANLTSIDPPEGSAQADNCAQFWPMARDEALEAYDWLFASTVAEPAVYVEDTLSGFTYNYALPNDVIAVRSLRRANGSFLYGHDRGSGGPHYELAARADGSPALYTHEPAVAVRYTRRVTDPSRYSPGFQSAVVFLLASMLAGPVIKGKAGAQMAEVMRQRYEKKVTEAALVEQNQRRPRVSYTASNIRARGATSDQDLIIEEGLYRYSLPFWAQS